MVRKSSSCWEEGPVITLLCAPRMQQSVTEGVLQLCNSFMYNSDVIFEASCLPLPALCPGGHPRAELAFLMSLSVVVFLQMAWRWMLQRWRPVSSRTQTLSTSKDRFLND
ncbi:hypothetical protein ILYODFUR_015334 [Ilyodon furcidens]|uniref:Uncharacterized protein n=1 Tax=Ilyodon furcidens TaxID=33524 RepID=A0ABV0U9V0_9TELE